MCFFLSRNFKVNIFSKQLLQLARRLNVENSPVNVNYAQFQESENENIHPMKGIGTSKSKHIFCLPVFSRIRFNTIF